MYIFGRGESEAAFRGMSVVRVGFAVRLFLKVTRKRSLFAVLSFYQNGDEFSETNQYIPVLCNQSDEESSLRLHIIYEVSDFFLSKDTPRTT